MYQRKKQQMSELANNVYQQENKQEGFSEAEVRSMEKMKSVFFLYRYVLGIAAVIAIAGIGAFLLFSAQSVYTAKLIPAFVIIGFVILQRTFEVESK